MAKSDFLSQLQVMGYTVQELAIAPHTYWVFDYEIPLGKFRGRIVQVGLLASDSFPMDPPPGPHFNPHLLPVTNQGGVHPLGGIHNSPLGQVWQYWSRPFTGWSKTDRTVKTYIAHLKNLLDTV